MKVLVQVIQLADRHADLHQRDFAQATLYTAEAGTLGEIFAQLTHLDLHGAKYSIQISEPFD